MSINIAIPNIRYRRFRIDKGPADKFTASATAIYNTRKRHVSANGDTPAEAVKALHVAVREKFGVEEAPDPE